MKNLKGQKGITLVALVVTIVVLLILAGVTIMYVLSDNGIFGKAESAATETDLATAKEIVAYAVLGVQTALADPEDHSADSADGVEAVFKKGIPSNYLADTTVTCNTDDTSEAVTSSTLNLSGTVIVNSTTYNFTYTAANGLSVTK